MKKQMFRFCAVLLTTVLLFGMVGYAAGEETLSAQQEVGEYQRVTEADSGILSAQNLRLSSMPDGGVVSYRYQEPPTAETTIYVGYKNDKGVLIQMTAYHTGMIQPKYDQGNQDVTYRYVLPDAPEGAVTGTAFFWGGSKMKPLEIESEVTPVSRSMTESAAFLLEQYTGYAPETGVVKYLANKNSNVEMAKTIQADATITYNGVPLAVNNNDSRQVLTNYFGNTISIGNDLGGKVTLLDTDEDPAYDIVNIEIAVTAVVKDVTSQGMVRFYMSAREAHTGNDIKLVFDENDPDTTINLTKNGNSISHTQLKAWDVVSIAWDGVGGIYNVEVLDDGNYVDGVISVVKSNGEVVLSDGNTYEISNSAYGLYALEPGLVGRFYIDNYGKIVAYDENAFVEGMSPVYEYAYVLNAKVVEGNWDGEEVVLVKLLNQDGEIYDVQMASKVKLVNFDNTLSNVVGSNFTYTKSFVADLNESYFIPDLSAFADGLVNRMVQWEKDANGEMKTLMVEAAPNSERDMALITSAQTSYDKEALMFKNGIIVGEHTKVFCIAPGNANNVTYGSNAVVASEEYSFVSDISELIGGETYTVLGFDPNANNEAKVIVLMNEIGRVDPAANIAVIEQVKPTVVNVVDEIYTVSYYMNGTLQTAVTKPGMTTDVAIANASRGDIVQLNVKDGVISYVKPLLVFDRQQNKVAYPKDALSTPVFQEGTPGTDEEYFFGAVTRIANNGAAIVQPLKQDGTGASTEETRYVKEVDANVYVYDVTRDAASRLSVGALGDADCDDMYADGETIYDKDGNALAVAPAYGMMDYVFVRNYENMPADIVVYKNYVFYWGDSDYDDREYPDAETPVASVPATQYGYVLNAMVVEGNWDGESTFLIRLLDTNGKVQEVELAPRVRLDNFDQTLDSVVGEGKAGRDSFVAELDNTNHITSMNTMARGLVNRAIAYELDAKGRLHLLTVDALQDSERPMALIASGSSTYHANTRSFENGVKVSDKTKVFFVTNEDENLAYATAENVADAGVCSLGSYQDLVDAGEYNVLGFAPDTNGYAQMVVLMNEKKPEPEVQDPVVANQYAYVLASKVVAGNWGGEDVVQMMLLNQDGEILEAELASKVRLVNFDQTLSSVIGTDGAGKSSFTAVLNQTSSITNLDGFADGLTNRMIAYQGNEDGKITAIVAEAAPGSGREMALIAGGNASYDKEMQKFGNGIFVNENTKVFCIAPGYDSVDYGSSFAYASGEDSYVSTINSLINKAVYSVYGFAPDENDEAQVIVLMNEPVRLDPAANVAVIDSIGATVLNGTDSAYLVSYYMDGELQTATTKPGMATKDVIERASQGDIVQLRVENDVITYAKTVLVFNSSYFGDPYAKDATANPVFTMNTPGSKDETYLFGAVTKFSNNGTALVEPLAGNGSLATYDHDGDSNTPEIDMPVQYVKEADANVYVYDIKMKKDYRLSIGSFADASVDEDLMTGIKVYDGATGLDEYTAIACPAYGMMDYVFVRKYDNQTADIVIYKNYDFGNYVVQ